MPSAFATETAADNPIDLVEELLAANAWLVERDSDTELASEVASRWCALRLQFSWAEDVSALQFSAKFDLKVPDTRAPEVYGLLAQLNSRMWLGHFDLCPDCGAPAFRQTLLLRGGRHGVTEQLEDLVEFAVTECERFYPAFQFVVWGGKTADEAIAAAILDTVGEA